eukprot:3000623-Alexandrium_andersonii.AAC.1
MGHARMQARQVKRVRRYCSQVFCLRSNICPSPQGWQRVARARSPSGASLHRTVQAMAPVVL